MTELKSAGCLRLCEEMEREAREGEKKMCAYKKRKKDGKEKKRRFVL